MQKTYHSEDLVIEIARLDGIIEDLEAHRAGVTHGGIAYGMGLSFAAALQEATEQGGDPGADGFRHGWTVAQADEKRGYDMGLEAAACYIEKRWPQTAHKVVGDLRALKEQREEQTP